jgi:hypothetical protein
MPHRVPTLFYALMQLFERYKEDVYLSLIIMLVELGRLLYFGGKWRKATGEGLISLVLIHVFRPHIPALPAFLGIHLSSYDVAFIIAACGVRGIRRSIEWAIHRYTGAKVKID